jgi:hypothetical protein
MIIDPVENMPDAAPGARAGSGPPCPRCERGTAMEPDVMRTRTHEDAIQMSAAPRRPLAVWRCPACGRLQPRLDG